MAKQRRLFRSQPSRVADASRKLVAHFRSCCTCNGPGSWNCEEYGRLQAQFVAAQQRMRSGGR